MLFNLGGGTFAAAVNLAVGLDPIGVAIADLDQDGRPELLSANEGSDSIGVLRNLGAGSFAAAVAYSVDLSPYAVGVSDIDLDGRLDVVSVNARSNNVSRLRVSVTGSLLAARSFPSNTQFQAVATADAYANSVPRISTHENLRGQATVTRIQGAFPRFDSTGGAVATGSC